MGDYRVLLQDLLDEDVAKGEAAGDSLLVLHRGREILYLESGKADREKDIPMRRDTIIRLFSMTKPVTAVALMILYERGQIGLLDPVSKYLPEYADLRTYAEGDTPVPLDRPITITDLLNMTSGIPYPENWEGCTRSGREMDALFARLLQQVREGKGPSTREWVREISAVPTVFQPGTRWLYGQSADILGAIIEIVSGMSFGEFLKREIFDPLQMPDTGFWVPEEKRDRFAMSYELWDDGLLHPVSDTHLGEWYLSEPAFESGGAGLVSTIDDYSRFASMLAGGGRFAGRRILGSATVRFMTRNRLDEVQRAPLNWGNNMGYGYGNLMRVLLDPGKAGIPAEPGEFGWDGWTGNYVSIDPSEDLIFLYFTQLRGAWKIDLMRALKAIVYAHLDDK
ncbi:MAG: beta-lactamase family protein [Lachnospiraceae bacterium]|nr:beta-lactamase family protein [Lachnospiraceae bacterium]